MSTTSREIEFKFAVAGRQAFDSLLKQLNLPDSLLDKGVMQTNHFFDSPSHCLHKNHIAIRLREEDGNNILTIKGEKASSRQGNNVLTDRTEQEIKLPWSVANDLLQGVTSPLRVINDHFGNRTVQLLDMIETACSDLDLVPIGKFSNVRIHLPPVSLHVGDTTEQLEFELDTSTFPDGRIEYECEIEISAHSDADAIEAALIKLFQQAGVEWHTAPSKAERFYAAISG